MNIYQEIKEALDDIFYKGGYINLIINKRINNVEKKNQPIFTKIVYGVVENKILLDYNINKYLEKEVKKDIQQYLRILSYGVNFTNLTNALVLNEIVEIIKTIDYKFVGLVNAVGKKICENKLTYPIDDKIKMLSIKYSYPEKLVDFLNRMYEEQIEDILKHPLDTFNTYRINPLKEFNIDELKCPYQLIDQAIVTKENLNNTKWVKNGTLINQNLSSQKVIRIIDKIKGMKVLDMCSAPGSKALMLAEEMNNFVDILCLDIHQHKIDLIEKQAKIQGVTSIRTKMQDATLFETNEQFDLIMLDAPCSGLGVMKHKVDLKYQFSFHKLEEIYILQKALLGKAYKLLKENGTLVYSTCTINKLENEEMIKYFLKKHKDILIEEEYKMLPNDIYDGFYICKMKKEIKHE